ncbi:MAG: DEAD/DEAH box helicase, partial [Sphingobacteriales bacterium]
NESAFTRPFQDNLAALMHEQAFMNHLPQQLFTGLNYVRKLGNVAAHNKVKPTAMEVLAALRYMHSFLGWLALSYSEDKISVPPFTEDIFQQKPEAFSGNGIYAEGKKEYKTDEPLASQTTDEASYKTKRSTVVPPKVPFTEAQTRKLFIDIMLREVGWDPSAPNVAEYELCGMPSKSGIGYADYVLWGDDGLPLAVVEAKHTSHDAAKGKRQAELYANCLEEKTGRRPLIFYTNGFETHFWDDTFYPPRTVYGIYTKDSMQRLVLRRNQRSVLSKMQPNKVIAGRYYQQEAISRVAEILEKKARKSLIVMATGAGKTRTAAALVDMLIKGGWVTRVLFLADRNALVRQAKNAFIEHLPHLTTTDLTKEKEDSSSRVVFSTYPTIMNRIDGERNEEGRYYSIGHFDLIIIDEAHRSVYQSYKAIFEYFDAILIGLTATPKSEIDRNTFELFGLEDYNPTYAYELDRAVKDEYLRPPKAVSVPLKFQREGIKYKELTEAEKEEYESTFRDEVTGEMPEEIDSAALNAWLFNKDTVDKVLAFLFERGLKVAGGDRLGKTIIFAKNHRHAIFIQERFDKMFPAWHGKFLRVIDNYEDYAQDLINKFSEKDREPHIAVSVDMLDTGIDIQEIVNLVFFKPVRSYAKFWQMIGRGTRLSPNLFGPGEDKQFFYIFDFCQNFEFFDVNPDGVKGSNQESLSSRLFKLCLRLAQSLAADVEHHSFREQLLDTCHAAIYSLNKDSFIVRMKLRYVTEFTERSRWDELSKSDILDIHKELVPLVMPEDEDEFGRRFDLLVLNMQLSLVEEGSIKKSYSEQIISIAQSLLKKLNIPMIMGKKELLQQIKQQEFWAEAGLHDLEKVRTEIRDLIRFLDAEKQKIVYTNFSDELKEVGEEREVVYTGNTKESYRAKIEKYINQNKQHITIQKLKSNMPITAAELEELERILFEGDSTNKKLLEQELGTEKPLGTFIRSIIGLDINAAKEAFSEFLGNGSLQPAQIHFINTLIDFLSRNGTIDKSMLIDSPFTDINDMGIYGVFTGEEVNKIFTILERIDNNARVA